ncbi:WXG100 family type VII secretion target [Christensenellaceae bacterium OttesenSCG-928-M15]|nr:WXG100 family type VII secretion target [Christensenellaceae bacterium OttesenSCG-928-M15]
MENNGTGTMQMDIAKATALAQDIRKCHQKLKSDAETVRAEIEKLKGIWTGDSATTFQAEFKTMYGQCVEALDDAQKIANGLDEAADVYKSAQKSIENAASDIKAFPDFSGIR